MKCHLALSLKDDKTTAQRALEKLITCRFMNQRRSSWFCRERELRESSVMTCSVEKEGVEG